VKRLLLLRHAKAVPAGTEIADRERALVARGREDAAAVGRYMKKHEFVPDFIMSSSSRRTVETVDLVTAELPGRRRVDLLEVLYLARPTALLATIRGAPDRSKMLMLVGHNPGMEDLATALAREPVRRKESDRFDLIEEKFPTAALAVIDFAVSHWRDVRRGQGEFVDFVRPEDL
jgi:phosphohistidine phosphatase